MDKPKQEKQTLQSEPPAPDTQSWYDYMLKAQQETPNRLEEAAKALAAIITTSLTLIIAIGGGDSQFQSHPNFAYIKITLLIWIISLVLSFFVLFPRRYPYISNSAESIQSAHRRIIRTKSILLLLSLILFLVALGVTGWLVLG